MINISGAAGETSCARDMPDACGNEFLEVFLNSSKQTFQFSLRIPNLLSPIAVLENDTFHWLMLFVPRLSARKISRGTLLSE
jgi:hypothetical protein